MSKTNGGGPAFPSLYPRSDEDGRQGMSLRAWLAGMAMQGLANKYESGVMYEGDIAKLAVSFADALIAELEKEVV